jgi:hypothetical protein
MFRNFVESQALATEEERSYTMRTSYFSLADSESRASERTSFDKDDF